MSVHDQSFFTIDPNVVSRCCDSMITKTAVMVGVDNQSGGLLVNGVVNRIRRLEGDRFEILVTPT